MRSFFGVVCALLALLCGGCSLAFLGSGTATNLADGVLILALGGGPALVFGVFAWVLLKGRQSTAPVTKPPSPPRS